MTQPLFSLPLKKNLNMTTVDRCSKYKIFNVLNISPVGTFFMMCSHRKQPYFERTHKKSSWHEPRGDPIHAICAYASWRYRYLPFLLSFRTICSPGPTSREKTCTARSSQPPELQRTEIHTHITCVKLGMSLAPGGCLGRMGGGLANEQNGWTQTDRN